MGNPFAASLGASWGRTTGNSKLQATASYRLVEGRREGKKPSLI